MHLDIKNLKKEKNLIKSQKWSMDKFVISNKQNITQNEMLIKSYLKSTMSQERLTSRLTILSIKNEMLE